MEGNIEMELCNNCKKEIPHTNYIMHTAHCARNITLCKVCNEPIPKLDYEVHREKCRKPVIQKPAPLPTTLESSSYFQQRKAVEDQKAAIRRENYLRRHEHLVDNGFTLNETVRNGYGNSSPSPSATSTTSNTNRTVNSTVVSSTNQIGGHSSTSSTSQGGAIKKPPLIPRLDEGSGPRPKGPDGLLSCKYCELDLPKLELEEHENYCGSRTDKCLECGELVMFKNKQVHLDSNHGFVKLRDGPAPQPPRRRRNPPTSLTIPCEFCDTPIPHEELIQHETGCRPDLARFNPRRSRSAIPLADEDDYTPYEAPRVRTPPRADSPDSEELPCEFCSNMVPASQLWRHQLSCTSSA